MTYEAGIMFLSPTGTNSTMFTDCCGTAICEDQKRCPNCKRTVIGSNAETNSERGKIRWKKATSLWRRRGGGEKVCLI